MKKTAFFSLILICSSLYALPSNKLVPAGSWVYSSIMMLAVESGTVNLAQAAPLSVGELKQYLLEIDPQSLSASGEKEYDRLLAYFNSEEKLTLNPGIMKFSAGASLTPELYYKSNAEIPWTFHYFYRDNVVSVPLLFDVGDYVTVETDVFAGKNWWASGSNSNWTNVPYQHDDFEFLWPRTAYMSAGLKLFGKECIGFQLGRGGISIGNTKTDSIILSQDFETEGYAQLSFFIPQFRYTADIIEVDVNKYLYLHRLDFHPFEWFTFGCYEGAYVNAPLELRYMNPLMIMHSMSYWTSYSDYNKTTADGDIKNSYGDSRCCAYFCLDFDVVLGKYVRFYGLYAQNEIQMPWELQSDIGKMVPNSMGGQSGIEVNIPSKLQGYWFFGLEGLYTTPWLYIKQDPAWSLYRSRLDNLKVAEGKINTWIGTQFGPDSIVGQLYGGYCIPGKWSAEMQYLLAVQGENSFNLFTSSTSSGFYTYYPYAGYCNGTYTAEEAIARAQAVTPTGIPQYTNRALIKGTYAILSWLEVSSQAAYTVLYNYGHVTGNFQSGVELACSVRMTL